MVGKATQTLGFLKRNLKNCPPKLCELAYFALVRSKLEYASVVWDPTEHNDSLSNSIEMVQRKAARFVMNDYGRYSSVTAMLQNLKWTTLAERRKDARLTMLYKIVNHKIAIDSDSYLFPANTRTRSKNNKKFIPYATSIDAYKYSFFPRTVPEWNNLDQCVIDCESVEAFKAALAKCRD